LRLEWHDYFCRLAAYLTTRAQEYDERAQSLMEDQPERSSMTEYESIQGAAKGPGVDVWRQVDKARSELTALYRSLAEDDTRTPDYKSERARDAYEMAGTRIEELAPEARRKMTKSAESLERMSIPTPEGESLITKDTDKLLLTAHERSRIEGLMSRSKEAAEKGPFGGKQPTDILREEYERGLDERGPSGGATVRACVGLARDLRLDLDPVVDGRRRDFHRGALEDARSARTRADMVSKNVPEPPFQRATPSKAKNLGSYNGRPAVLKPASDSAGSGPFTKKRRPSWK
jgi:hypothetical protein